LPSLLQLENERAFTSARVHATDLSALKNIFGSATRDRASRHPD
jgi:hypothetical protein